MRKPCKVHSCRTLIAFPHKYRKQRCLFQFLHRRTAVCCICFGSCCNPAKFEKTKKMHRLFQYGARYLLFCRLPVSQRTPCSENRAFGWRLLNRTPKPCKVHSCRTLIPFPHKYRKQRCPFRFLQQKMAVCCICFGSCCNPAKFEKTKKMHRLFQYGARCLSVRKRLAARTGRSGGDYRAECGSLARFTLTEHRYHSHTNTGNNIADSSFCNRGWLSAVSVLGAAAIRQGLNTLAWNPPAAESTLHKYDKSGSIRPDR